MVGEVMTAELLVTLRHLKRALLILMVGYYKKFMLNEKQKEG